MASTLYEAPRIFNQEENNLLPMASRGLRREADQFPALRDRPSEETRLLVLENEQRRPYSGMFGDAAGYNPAKTGSK